MKLWADIARPPKLKGWDDAYVVDQGQPCISGDDQVAMGATGARCRLGYERLLTLLISLASAAAPPNAHHPPAPYLRARGVPEPVCVRK